MFDCELSLPLGLMHSPPQSAQPHSLPDWVLQKHNAFLKAYELVRRNTTAQQSRRNKLSNKSVQSPTYKEGEHVPLYYPVVPIEKSPKHSSPWRAHTELQNV